MKRVTIKLKMKANRVVLSLVCLGLGFLIAYSYQFTKKELEKKSPLTDRQWNRTVELRNQLANLENSNRKLQKELEKTQEKLFSMEESFATDEERLFNLTSEVEQLRLFLGKVKTSGPGLQVTLDDGDYDPADGDINNFIVHEHHVFRVVNELYIAGAEAIAINGKRLTRNSYIICNGPVITVDGDQFPAPFVISAIGKADVLDKALSLTGGVKDQLVNDNITVKIEKKDQLVFEPLIGTGS